ncbi:MAG: hypothetical protein ACW99A_09160 [Candidatus Kariarchaeaceae archaeon]
MPSQFDIDAFDMKNRLRNKNRAIMLIKIYHEPQRYQDLISITKLKPGSIYHHIRILDDLIVKKDHGTYVITELGRKVVEHFNLVDEKAIKPTVSLNFKEVVSEDVLSNIWIGHTSIILAVFVLLITLLLGSEGVALAGSAVYYVGFPIAYVFDVIAIFLGWLSLVLIYRIQGSNSRQEYVFETFMIRSFSMFPGSLLGISVYILFLVDIFPTQGFFEILFGLSLVLGLIFASTGFYYLKNKTMKDSILLSLLPTSIDLTLGIVILLS